MMPEETLNIDWGDEKVQRTQRLIERNPYDLEGWSALLREAQTRHISDMRPLYERLLVVFPNAARYWKIYIEHEVRVRNYEKAEKLFQRSLIKILNIDLWKLYLSYVKDTKANLPTYKEKMAQAYDFALDKIGMDIHSYSIWNDYVNFLKSVDAIGSYAENQKISAIRKVYQRGMVNPMLNIEQFWKDYITFEQNINSILAEKMSRERSKDYINARRVSKELEVQIRGINRNLPNIPPTGSTDESRQVELWRKYIAWEKSNPLRTEDLTLVVKRTLFAYEQCLLCLGHHPDIWYQATQFLQQSSKQLHEKGDANGSKLFGDESANVFERAITTLLTKNMLIYFAYADYEEIRMKYDKVHQIYEKFLDKPDVDPTLCYIQYMKFARRIEGIKSARNIFKRAREDPRSQFQVYIAAALMEYYCSKEKNIALRIFELGLKKYASDAKYVLAYVDYLSQLNDDNNTRVLFERVLSSGSLDAENSVPVWNRFLELESNIGDLQTIMKVEKRRTDALEKIRDFEGKEAAHLVDRYKFLDLFPCSPIELKTIGYGDIVANSLITIPSTILSTCFGHQIKTGDCLVNNNSALEDDNWAKHIPQPDSSQMIPYKPKLNALSHEHRIPGGVFQLPQAVSQLSSILPPPQFYRGPYVSRELLCDHFNRMLLPETCPDPVPTENGSSTKLFDLTRSVNWIQTDSTNVLKRKSKLVSSNASVFDSNTIGSDDDDTQQPPAIDIYRMRQQKRARFI